MKAKRRKCKKCGDPLGRQKGFHKSTKEVPARYGNGLSNWCDGPSKTPGGSSRPRPRKPVHYRFYASPDNDSVCGLRGGRLAGRYKDADAQIPWTRLNVKLEQTTCEECLALVAVFVDAKLKTRLALVGKSMEAALEVARGRLTMNGLRKAVGA